MRPATRLRSREPSALVLLAAAATLALPGAPGVQAQELPRDPPVLYDDDRPSAGFHRSRRAAVKQALPDGSVALLVSAPHPIRQNDVRYEYRQQSDLLYLTGAPDPGSVLLLAPGGMVVDGEPVTEVLFVPAQDPSEEVWTGRRLGPDGARTVLGMEAALPLDRFREVAGPVLREAGTLYRLPAPPGVEDGSELASQLALLDEAAPGADRTTLRRLLDGLRMRKTEEELHILQRAVDITAAAHRELARSIEPGMHEYEAEAVVEYVFKRMGATGPGFPSIVGSGENSVILHYETNRKPMEAGETVVVDIGAEVHGYTADVTRTYPVDGTFSPEARALYEIVLEAWRAGIDAVRPGAPFRAPHDAATAELARGLARLGLIDGPGDVSGLRRFYMHGTSHYLGLDVHDVGTGQPLVPGTVLTVEPGLYVAPAPDVDPRWWNLGIRVEDDVLVTADGARILSEGAPRDPAAVERLMAEEGLGNRPVGRD